MKIDQYLYDEIRPALKQMDLWSLSAEKILIMIASHESSGLKHRKQIKGPALSYFQIEPSTFKDIWDRYLKARKHYKSLVAQFLPADVEEDDIDLLDELKKNDKFAIAVARMKLFMIPETLPQVTDDQGLAEYAKKYWNTYKGKATPEKYLKDFKIHALDKLEEIPEGWS
jgi:hypothetical protein